MELVLDDDGHAVLENGLPVYKYEDGSKSPFNAKTTVDNLNKKIQDITEEKTRHFTNLEKLKKDFKPFKKIDIKAATEALETVKNLKTKELLDSNGVKILKADILASEAEKRTELKTTHAAEIAAEKDVNLALRNTIKYQAIKTEFSNSEYFSGKSPKTIYPPDDAVRIFGHLFEVEGEADGGSIKIFARDKDGTPMMSQKNHGDPADFDEAMGKIIDEHPNKARILNTKPGGPMAGGNLGPGKQGEYASSTDKIAAGLKRHHSDAFGS